MSWIRSGYCCRCGQCCAGNIYEADPNNPNWSEAMKRTPPVEGMCPLFELHKGAPEGEGFCIGHTGAVPEGQEDPYYLQGCNVWPSDPHCIAEYDRCTYTFTWQADE